ncbi:MAG: AAC(3) family N-acetyltransferase [Actinomycetota bacterium]
MTAGAAIEAHEIDASGIEAAARALGLTDRAVCVHASLRSFGSLANGPATIIDGLLAAGCTVLAATMAPELFGIPAPFDDRPARNGIDYEEQDMDRSPLSWPGLIDTFDSSRPEVSSWLGAFSAHVAARPDRVRCRLASGELAAVGPLARELIGAETEADVFGPLRALADHDGAVVLMGVGLNRMTLLHLAEVEAGRRPFVRWSRGTDGQPARAGVGGCSEGFEQLAATLAPVEHGAKVGQSRWRVFAARPALDLAAAAIRLAPSITHCPEADCIECADAIAGGPIE